MSEAPPEVQCVVVDDEAQVADVLARFLRREGYVTTVFVDPRAALAHFATARADVVVCDLQMPHLNGRQLYDAVVSLRPDHATRFVLVSGGTLDPELARFFARFHGTCLRKPFGHAELQAVVRAVLAARAGGG